MPDVRCLNCDAAVRESLRFCPHCSQRTDTTRLSIPDFLRELMHSFLNVERGPFAMLKALAMRPGRMAREYVDGKRRRYYGPFATLAVLVGINALAINLSGYRMLARDGFEALATDLLQRHFNVLQLLQLPVLGAVCAVIFRSARLNFSEHMVLAAYALSMRAIVLVLVIPYAVMTASSEPTQMEFVMFWIAWYAYFGWAASQFYAGNRAVLAVKGVLAAVICYGVLLMLISAGSAAHAWLLGAWPWLRAR